MFINMKKIIKLSVLIYLVMTTYVYAYIDPAMGSAILTAIIGFFVTGMVLVKSYFYKIKNFFYKKKIEKNKYNKNLEK